MPEIRVTIDPCNPGQFYACCGIIEMCELAGATTLSYFAANQRLPRQAEFVLSSDKELTLAFLIGAVKEATYSSLERVGSDNPPNKDSIAPARAEILGRTIDLDWWLDEFQAKAKQLKCWAGQVTTRKLLTELPRLLTSENCSFDADAFTSTRFGLDPRSAWVALNLGYSPNEQGQESRSYPVVEMLAAFGLQGFRPKGDRAGGFEYWLWHDPLPIAVARCACTEAWDGLNASRYRFELGERGSYKFFSFAEPILSRSIV